MYMYIYIYIWGKELKNINLRQGVVDLATSTIYEGSADTEQPKYSSTLHGLYILRKLS